MNPRAAAFVLVAALAPGIALAMTPGLYRFNETMYRSGSAAPTGRQHTDCVTKDDIDSVSGIIASLRACRTYGKAVSGAEVAFTPECEGRVERVSGRMGAEGFVFTTVVEGAGKDGVVAREIRGSRLKDCP